MEHFDFVIDGYLFKSTQVEDFIVNSKVIPLFIKNIDIIADDYWDRANSDILFKQLIDLVTPYFFTIYNEKGAFIGYMFLSDWRGGGHTAAFHTTITREAQGTTTNKVAKKVAQELFTRFDLNRIDCTIPIYNRKTMVFASRCLKCEFEGIKKGLSQKNGRPLDYAVYALTRSKEI